MEKLQSNLLTKYAEIEGFDKGPWDMRLKENQIEAKGFMFRVIEELGESFESFKKEDFTNFWTELADATHFLLELGLVTGVRMEQSAWDEIWQGLEESPVVLHETVLIDWFWDASYKLSLVSNALRNKTWKQTEVLPDLHRFETLMAMAYRTFFMGFRRIGASEKLIFEWYWRKNQVNLFRIRSKY